MDVHGVKIQFLGHSGFLIEHKNGTRIAIDPYNLPDKVDAADMILITHSHYDHCSIKDIEKLCRKGTIVVIPADAQSKITRVKDVEMHTVEVGDNFEFSSVKIEAVPSYNLNKHHHSKSEGWVGYVIKLNEVVVYHAGDSDKIPEMKNLTGYGKHGNYFIALLPVSGETVMNVDEAVEVASLLSPDLAIPMHYGAGVLGTIDDAKNFVEKCKELNINAEMLEKQ